MSPNILITGAAGYIGGSIVTDFLRTQIFQKEQVYAAVRSEEQAQALSKLGINVLQLDLSNEKAVVENLARYRISIVIHTASSIDPSYALNLITALSKQKMASGEATYFIHTSALSAFYERTGWPQAETKDTDDVFRTEKELAESYPIRKTDVSVIEHAQASGITSFIIVPSTVYGKGSGEWNKLSVVIPPIVRASIANKSVTKFPENTKVAGVHISDLTALYGLIVSAILAKDPLPSGTEGYYFAIAHSILWWETLDHLATALKARDLVTEASVAQVWPDDKAAADAYGVPEAFVQALWNSGENMKIEKPYTLGWKPKWDQARFLRDIDAEVQAVIEEGHAKSSLVDSLFAAAMG